VSTVRYKVDGVPAAWADAWFPMPTQTPAAATSISRFTKGAPGTVPVHTPRPAGSMSLSRSPEWLPGSAVAPDATLFNEYVNEIAELKIAGGVSYMPRQVAALVEPVGHIGAHGPLGPSQVVMGGRKVGGRRSMHWPRTITRWPNLRGT